MPYFHFFRIEVRENKEPRMIVSLNVVITIDSCSGELAVRKDSSEHSVFIIVIIDIDIIDIVGIASPTCQGRQKASSWQV